jgi:hypothetical protein
MHARRPALSPPSNSFFQMAELPRSTATPPLEEMVVGKRACVCDRAQLVVGSHGARLFASATLSKPRSRRRSVGLALSDCSWARLLLCSPRRRALRRPCFSWWFALATRSLLAGASCAATLYKPRSRHRSVSSALSGCSWARLPVCSLLRRALRRPCFSWWVALATRRCWSVPRALPRSWSRALDAVL